MPNRDAQRAALVSAVAGGVSLRAACRDLGVPYATAHRWWADYRPVAGGADDGATGSAGSRKEKAVAYEDRLEALLDASLGTMLAQVRHMADPDWMRRQDARDLGLAYGIVTDKAARIAGLLERFREPPPAPDGPGDDVDGAAETGPLAGGD